METFFSRKWSNPYFEQHINVVNQTLFDIGASNKKIILVFNKIDKDTVIDSASQDAKLLELQNTWMNNIEGKSVFISAQNNINIDELKNKIVSF